MKSYLERFFKSWLSWNSPAPCWSFSLQGLSQPLVSRSDRYKCFLTSDRSGCVRQDRTAIREIAKYDGKRVLQTNDDTLSPEDATAGYKGLLVIERCFPTLKRTRIQMEPMYHWLPRRIETHITFCVFALLIERVGTRHLLHPILTHWYYAHFSYASA